jgi:hypothetical protein
MKEYLVFSAGLLTLIVTVLSGSIIVAEAETSAQGALRTCSEAWRTKLPSEIPPGPDDTHDPRTGKELSQTPGAKRSRAAKLKAFKEHEMLECIKRQ